MVRSPDDKPPLSLASTENISFSLLNVMLKGTKSITHWLYKAK